MAVDSHLPEITVASSASSSASSSLPAYQRLKRIATENSSAFIFFPPSKHRLNRSIVPVHRAQPSISSTRHSSAITDPHSVCAPIISNRNRIPSQYDSNPILQNPLLNHRHETLLIPPKRHITSNSSQITRLCLPSVGPKAKSKRTIRAGQTLPQNTQRLTQNLNRESTENSILLYLGRNKFDYIHQWLVNSRCDYETTEI